MGFEPIPRLLAGFLTGAWLLSAASSGRPIVVLSSAGGEAFAQALEGVRQAAPSIQVVDLDRSPAPELPSGAVIVALGSRAAHSAAWLRPAAPVIVAMVLESDSAYTTLEMSRVVARVFLDVSLDAVLAHLQRFFPGKPRLGWIRNPRRSGPQPEPLLARARERGFTVTAAECAGPESLLAALRSLKGRADLVWCEPDSTLYNAATVKPLILASLDLQLPVIGFSESFVRAGAAIGVYPDFREIGRQAGELAARYSAGQSIPSREPPRRLQVAVNERMARLLGFRYPASGELLVLR